MIGYQGTYSTPTLNSSKMSCAYCIQHTSPKTPWQAQATPT